MVTYFVDTSALVKRYVPERGSERMDSLFLEKADVVISTLTVVELASNLQRLRTVDGVISESLFTKAWAAFSVEIATGRIRLEPVSGEVVEAATDLLLSSYVTPIDAVQLVTARALGPETVVVSSDRKLNQLAASQGLSFIDPTGGQARPRRSRIDTGAAARRDDPGG